MLLGLIFSALLILMYNLGMTSSIVGIVMGAIVSFCLWEFYLESQIDGWFDRIDKFCNKR